MGATETSASAAPAAGGFDDDRTGHARSRGSGHAGVEIATPGGQVVLVDPWYGNPNSPRAVDGAGAVRRAVPDARALRPLRRRHARRSPAGCTRRCPASTSSACTCWRQLGDAAEVIGMNAGGTVETHGIRVTMVPAVHSSGDLMGGTRRPLLRRADRVRARARERLPRLRLRGHDRVRRHGADPRAVRARPRDPADRRPLHDGPGRGGGRGRPARRARRAARSTGARSRSSPARRRRSRPSWTRAASRRTSSTGSRATRRTDRPGIVRAGRDVRPDVDLRREQPGVSPR